MRKMRTTISVGSRKAVYWDGYEQVAYDDLLRAVKEEFRPTDQLVLLNGSGIIALVRKGDFVSTTEFVRPDPDLSNMG